MNEKLLKDFIATAQKNNYNWNVVFDKFPELENYDKQLLKDYVATAEKNNYNYEVVNSKFPEFGFKKKSQAENGGSISAVGSLELQKPEDYTYGDNKSAYRKQGNQWLISNESTKGNYVAIKDPTGSRTKELEKNAVKKDNKFISKETKKEYQLENNNFSEVNPEKQKALRELNAMKYAPPKPGPMGSGSMPAFSAEAIKIKEDEYNNIPSRINLEDDDKIKALNKQFGKNASLDADYETFGDYDNSPEKKNNKYRIKNNSWERLVPGATGWSSIENEGSINALNNRYGQNIDAKKAIVVKPKEIDPFLKVNSNFLAQSEESAQQVLEKNFKGMGFTFEQTGAGTDYITVTPNNGAKPMTFSFDEKSSDEAVKLQSYLRLNASAENEDDLSPVNRIKNNVSIREKKYDLSPLEKNNEYYNTEDYKNNFKELTFQQKKQEIKRRQSENTNLSSTAGTGFAGKLATSIFGEDEKYYENAKTLKKFENKLNNSEEYKVFLSEKQKYDEQIEEKYGKLYDELSIAKQSGNKEAIKIAKLKIEGGFSKELIGDNLTHMTGSQYDLQRGINNFNKRKEKLELYAKNKTITQEQYNDGVESLSSEAQRLDIAAKNVAKSQKMMDALAGVYVTEKAKSGGFFGNFTNSILVSMDEVREPLSYIVPALGKDLSGEEERKIATEAQIITPQQRQYYKDKGYNEQEIKNVFINNAQKNAIAANKRAIIETFGSDLTTEESKQNLGFIQQALVGVAASLPSMALSLIPVVGGAAAFGGMANMSYNAINEEMLNDIDFETTSEADRAVVAVPYALVMGALEKIGLKNMTAGKAGIAGKFILSQAAKLIPKGASREVAEKIINNEVKNIFAKGGIKIVRGTLAEFETGLYQSAALDYGLKALYNELDPLDLKLTSGGSLTGGELFDTPDTKAGVAMSILEGGVAEAIGGFAMSTVMVGTQGLINGKISLYNEEDLKFFEDFTSDQEFKKLIVSNLKTQMLNGTITKGEAQSALNDIDLVAGVFNSIDENISDEAKVIAFNLINERNRLEKEVIGKDAALSKEKNDRIKDINNKLGTLPLQVLYTNNVERATALENALKQKENKAGTVTIDGKRVKRTVAETELNQINQKIEDTLKKQEEATAKTVIPEEILNLEDNEVKILAVKTLEEIPEQFRDRAQLSPLTEVETREKIFGLPIGKKGSKLIGGGYTYTLTGKEAKDYAIQEQTAGQVPVQPTTTVGEEVVQGEPTAEPQVLTEEGKAEEVAPLTLEEELRRMTYDELFDELKGYNFLLMGIRGQIGNSFRVMGTYENELIIDYIKPDGEHSNFSIPVSEALIKKYENVEWSEDDIKAKYEEQAALESKSTTDTKAVPSITEEGKAEEVAPLTLEEELQLLEEEQTISPVAEETVIEVEATPQEKVATYRAEEQAELLKAIPKIESYKVKGKIDKTKMPKTVLAKYNKIYEKYDKLISPLLEQEVTPTQQPAPVVKVPVVKKAAPKAKGKPIVMSWSKVEEYDDAVIRSMKEIQYGKLKPLLALGKKTTVAQKTQIEEIKAKISTAERILDKRANKIKNEEKKAEKGEPTDKGLRVRGIDNNGNTTEFSIVIDEKKGIVKVQLKKRGDVTSTRAKIERDLKINTDENNKRFVTTANKTKVYIDDKVTPTPKATESISTLREKIYEALGINKNIRTERNKKIDFDEKDDSLTNEILNILKEKYPEVKFEFTDNDIEFIDDPMVLMQLSNKMYAEFKNLLIKKRPDLVERKLIDKVLDDIYTFSEEFGTKQNKIKLQKITLHWILNSSVILPEDGPKVAEALRISEAKKLDAFSYSNPNEIIEQFAVETKKEKTNPDTLSSFTNKKDIGNGVVVYDVENSEKGQEEARIILDTHFGENSNPWCLLYKDADGSLTRAKEHWFNTYPGPKKIAFRNGRLLCFYGGGKWWNRLDQSSNGIPITQKIPNDELQRKQMVVVSDNDANKVLSYGNKIRGNKDNGIYEEYDNNDNIIFKETYKDGKQDGESIYYYDNGQISSKTTYKDNKLDGERIGYYRDGQISSKETYKDGKRDGESIGYYGDGQISSKTTYKDGSIDGESIDYYDNGQINSKETYKDGKRDGESIGYHYNGQISSKETYKDGKLDGERIGYYRDGQISSKTTYKDGKLDGERIGYYRDGQISSKETYKDGKQIEFSRLGGVNYQKNKKNEIIGQADTRALTILVNRVKQRKDTIPHEYAHIYISMFRDSAIVQEGIKRFGSEEALVQAIGEQVVQQKGEAYNWWVKFTNFILNLLSDKQVLQVLTDSFINRTDLNTYGFNEYTKKEADNLYSKYIEKFPSGDIEGFKEFVFELQSKAAPVTEVKKEFVIDGKEYTEKEAIEISQNNFRIPNYGSKMEYNGSNPQAKEFVNSYNRDSSPYNRNGDLKGEYIQEKLLEALGSMNFRKFGNLYRKHINQYFSREANEKSQGGWVDKNFSFRELAGYIIGDASPSYFEEASFRAFAKEAGIEIPTAPVKEETETEKISRGADMLKNMSEDERGNFIDDWRENKIPRESIPGGAKAIVLYEAKKIVPNPTSKPKRVSSNNAFSLSMEHSFVINIDGVIYGLNKYEDPDATSDALDKYDEPRQYVWAYTNMNEGGEVIETNESDIDELINEIKSSKKAEFVKEEAPAPAKKSTENLMGAIDSIKEDIEETTKEIEATRKAARDKVNKINEEIIDLKESKGKEGTIMDLEADIKEIEDILKEDLDGLKLDLDRHVQALKEEVKLLGDLDAKAPENKKTLLSYLDAAIKTLNGLNKLSYAKLDLGVTTGILKLILEGIREGVIVGNTINASIKAMASQYRGKHKNKKITIAEFTKEIEEYLRNTFVDQKTNEQDIQEARDKFIEIREAVRKAKLAVKTESKALRANAENAIREMLKGKVKNLTAVQMKSIMIRLARFNVFSQTQYDKFIDYVDKVIGIADYDTKVAKANENRKTAKKNLPKLGDISSDLLEPLSRVLSINAKLIPKDVFESYSEIVEMLSKRDAILELNKRADLNESLDKIIESIELNEQRVSDLKELYDNFAGKVVENNVVNYAKTLDEMLKDGIINQAEHELMKTFKSKIAEAKVKEKMTEQEIADEKAELIDEINNTTITLDEIVGDEFRLERDLVKRLQALLKNKESLESLNNKELKDLLRIIDNINNGFVSNATQEMVEKLNFIEKSILLESSIPKSFQSIAKKINQVLTKVISKDKFGINVAPLFNIDQQLGDFKTKNIFNSVFNESAKAQQGYQSAITLIQDELANIERAIAKSLKNDTNNIVLSQFKMMVYMMQLEYNSNPTKQEGSKKQVHQAMKTLDETIKFAKQNSEKSGYNDLDVAQMEFIKEKFEKDGQIDIDILYNSFNEAEKNGLKKLQEINNRMTKFATYTATVINGKKIVPLKNYISYTVINESDILSASETTDQINNINANMQPGTVSKNLEERDGKAHPVYLNPFYATNSSSRSVLLNYHMTEAVRTSRKTLRNTKTLLQANADTSTDQYDILNAITDAYNTATRDLLESNFVQSNEWLEFFKRQGYRSMLASGTRAAAELSSNISFVLTNNPFDMKRGYSKEIGKIKGVERKDIMTILKSNVISRLYPQSSINSVFVELTTNSNISTKGRKTKTKIVNGVKQVWDSKAKKYVDVVAGAADFLISKPDQAVMRPLWFGSFSRAFEKETGIKPDFNKIMENNEEYIDKYKDALEKATAVADKQITSAGSSMNSYMGILQNVVRQDDKGRIVAIKEFNRFMNKFTVQEYYTAREGVRAALGNGSMTRGEGVQVLAAVTLRMTIYSVFTRLFAEGVLSVLGYGDDDDEKTTKQKISQGILSTVTTLVFGRYFGNFIRVAENALIELANKEYGEAIGLRDGEYDPYKDAVQFNQLQDGKISKTTDLVKVIAGPYSPIIGLGDLGIKLAIANPKTDRAKLTNKKELYIRLPLEVGGALGVVPFYKDIKKVALAEVYKELKKETKEKAVKTKAKEIKTALTDSQKISSLKEMRSIGEYTKEEINNAIKRIKDPEYRKAFNDKEEAIKKKILDKYGYENLEDFKRNDEDNYEIEFGDDSPYRIERAESAKIANELEKRLNALEDGVEYAPKKKKDSGTFGGSDSFGGGDSFGESDSFGGNDSFGGSSSFGNSSKQTKSRRSRRY